MDPQVVGLLAFLVGLSVKSGVAIVPLGSLEGSLVALDSELGPKCDPAALLVLRSFLLFPFAGSKVSSVSKIIAFGGLKGNW